MAIAIKVENISKAYQLGTIGTGTISNDISRWLAKMQGKEDPFLKIGEANDRSVKGTSDIVWSLKDIDFSINEGDAVGVIGRNGAGKSTLLKILSRVTAPTTGNIKIKGKIASLLEVGTGFHPELTGRENIYLNGAILGMRKREIKRKFEQIVDFSGVERYIDTPVKRYSSGMYVRLAFAVAAHLDSEILIVDEVLAVGDAEFQRKCLGKMGEVSKGEGRTILFVSHNMSSVAQLCSKSILMHNGKISFSGSSHDTIEKYLSNNDQLSDYSVEDNILKPSQILSVEMLDAKGILSCSFSQSDDIQIIFKIKNVGHENGLVCAFSLYDSMEKVIIVHRIDIIANAGYVTYKVTVPGGVFIPNYYKIKLSLYVPHVKLIEMLEEYLTFEIVDTGSEYSRANEKQEGIIVSNLQIDVVEVNASLISR